jgi:hypothetical protein
MRNYGCKICKFFEPLNEPLGLCKRHAPTPEVYVTKAFEDLNDSKLCETRWPPVFDNNWCGEFETQENHLK